MYDYPLNPGYSTIPTLVESHPIGDEIDIMAPDKKGVMFIVKTGTDRCKDCVVYGINNLLTGMSGIFLCPQEGYYKKYTNK